MSTGKVEVSGAAPLVGRQYLIEDVFESFKEYQGYLLRALALFQDTEKKHNPNFRKYVPEFLEIEFNAAIKAPRLHFPRFKGVIVVQLPIQRGAGSPKQRAAQRERMLVKFASVVKVNELAVADELAVRMKIMREVRRERRARV